MTIPEVRPYLVFYEPGHWEALSEACAHCGKRTLALMREPRPSYPPSAKSDHVIVWAYDANDAVAQVSATRGEPVLHRQVRFAFIEEIRPPMTDTEHGAVETEKKFKWGGRSVE